jgi:hypothetical protein
MPNLNRRNFLQMISAAGLAPALPAFATTGVGASSGMSSAQMLWLSMYKRAESASELTSLAKSMGISTEAAQGVYAKLIRTHALAAHSISKVSQTSSQVAPSPTAPSVSKIAKPHTVSADIKNLVSEKVKVISNLDQEDTQDESDFIQDQSNRQDGLV